MNVSQREGLGTDGIMANDRLLALWSPNKTAFSRCRVTYQHMVSSYYHPALCSDFRQLRNPNANFNPGLLDIAFPPDRLAIWRDYPTKCPTKMRQMVQHC
jgi:hypothetical protein